MALNVQPSEVAALVRGELSRFPVERLIRFLNALGRDVEIVVKDAPAPGGQGTFTVAA